MESRAVQQSHFTPQPFHTGLAVLNYPGLWGLFIRSRSARQAVTLHFFTGNGLPCTAFATFSNGNGRKPNDGEKSAERGNRWLSGVRGVCGCLLCFISQSSQPPSRQPTRWPLATVCVRFVRRSAQPGCPINLCSPPCPQPPPSTAVQHLPEPCTNTPCLPAGVAAGGTRSPLNVSAELKSRTRCPVRWWRAASGEMPNPLCDCWAKAAGSKTGYRLRS